jgi:hypothetical protein
MKFNQEQIKKMVLAGLLLIALLYGYFTFLLGPLQKSKTSAASGIDTTLPQIDDANKQIRKTATLEKEAPQAIAFLNTVKSSIPDGEPIAWFPPKISDFFRARGIDKCTAHIVSEADSTTPGFKRMIWAIDIPKVEFVPLGTAISSLENNEPLITVLDVTVDATREDAQFQHATLTISTLVKS